MPGDRRVDQVEWVKGRRPCDETINGPSANGMLAWIGWYFEMNWSVNPHWVAGVEAFPGHPAANGIEPFGIDDEWHFHMRFVEGMKDVTPILSAKTPAETMKRPDGPHSGNPAVRAAWQRVNPNMSPGLTSAERNAKKAWGFSFTGLHYHWNW